MHCRAADSTGIKAEGEGEWNARKPPSRTCHACAAGQRVAPSGASGARYTSLAVRVMHSMIPRGELMRKRWKFGRLMSPVAISATPPYYRNCWTRPERIRTSRRSQPAGPAAQEIATRQSLPEMLPLSYRHARTQSLGNQRVPAPSPATKRCEPRSTWAVPSGDGEAAATAGAVSRYEEDQKRIRGILFPAIG